MQITLVGQTDKRPIIYTLLKMCEHLGDCLYVTNDRKAMRLMEGGPDAHGTYRNIQVHVLDTTADDVWADIGYAPSDFEYILFDNLYNENTGLTIYVKGAGVDQEDLPIIEALEPEEYVTIKMGKPDKKGDANHKVYNIPYTASIPEMVEYCEFYKELKPASDQTLKVCSEILAGISKIPVQTLRKVATTKR